MSAVSITLDDEQAQAMFARLATLISQPAKTMRASAQAARRLVYDTFTDETDPWGRRWPRWAPSTRASRARSGAQGRMLLQTGALYRSIEATADDGGIAIQAGGAGAPYADFHQFGNPLHRAWGRKPSPLAQRAFLPVRAPGVADIPAAWWAEILLPVETALARAAA